MISLRVGSVCMINYRTECGTEICDFHAGLCPAKNHRFLRHPQQNEKRIHRPACVTISRFLVRPRDGADSDSPASSTSLGPLSFKSCFAQQMSGQTVGAARMGKAPGTDGGTITKEAASSVTKTGKRRCQLQIRTDGRPTRNS